jgi:hypothetical protein
MLFQEMGEILILLFLQVHISRNGVWCNLKLGQGPSMRLVPFCRAVFFLQYQLNFYFSASFPKFKIRLMNYDLTLQYKKEVDLMLEMARASAKSHMSSGETTDKSASSPIITQDSS